MPDELSAEADPRSIEDILNMLLLRVGDMPRHVGPEYERNYNDLQQALKPRLTPDGLPYSPLPSYDEEMSVPMKTPYGWVEQNLLPNHMNKYSPGRVADPDFHENYYSSSTKKDI